MRSSIIFLLILLLNINRDEAFRLKITKMLCNNTDEAFATIETCRVRAVARDLQYYQLCIKWLQVSVTDVDVRFRFMKRANGYKPFLYDFTFKCDTLKHLNPVTTIVWTWFKDSSNLNHSCPLTEDFEVKRLENRYLEKQLLALPVPIGDYALFVSFKAYNITRFNLGFYGTIDY